MEQPASQDLSHLDQTDELLLSLQERQYLMFQLMDHIPGAVWNEDNSQLYIEIIKIKCNGYPSIEDYLNDHPEEFVNLKNKIKILHCNQATLKLLGYDGHDIWVDDLYKHFAEGSDKVLLARFQAYWNKEEKLSLPINIISSGGISTTCILSQFVPHSFIESQFVTMLMHDMKPCQHCDYWKQIT